MKENTRTLHPHEYYKQLAVLQRSTRLTLDQYQQLDDHMRACSECRALADQSTIITLLIHEAAEAAQPTKIPKRLHRKLHSNRAKYLPSDIELTNHGRQSIVRLLLAAAAIVLVAAVSFYAGRLSRHDSGKPPTGVITNQQQPSGSQLNPPPAFEQVTLNEQLRKANEELHARTQELTALQQNLDQVLQGRQALQTRVSELAPENEKLNADLAKAQNELQTSRAELNDLRAKEQADHVAANLAETEVGQLQQSEAKLKQQLEEAKRVQALLTDAQRLMEDPNLHTLYVDEKVGGKERRGRLFYSEGQYCKFYAWNLGDPAATKDATFVLWGERQDGAQRKIINLGQFELANAAARRWLLNVDPHTISRVTSVFVTREKSATTQPTGERMLFREITPLYGN